MRMPPFQLAAFLLICAPLAARAQVRITEFMASNNNGIRDDHGNLITGVAAPFSPVGAPDSGRQTLDLVGIADGSVTVLPGRSATVRR